MVFSDDFPAPSEDQENICRIHQNYLVALKTNQLGNGYVTSLFSTYNY